jgi:hypothetical protein
MTTFLRVELAGRDGDSVLINVDHIVRIHRSWPQGSSIVLSDNTSLTVGAMPDEIQTRLTSSNGRVVVYPVISRLSVPQVDEVYEAARADVLP